MWTPDEDVAREMEVQGKSMQEAYSEHKISDRLQRAHNDYRPCQYLVTEVRPELIICYLELKCNTCNNFEPYYFDADSVMTSYTDYLHRSHLHCKMLDVG